MKKQKTGLGYAKVQALYLLKINAVETIRHLAVIIGRGESTVHRWLQTYKTGGLSLAAIPQYSDGAIAAGDGSCEYIHNSLLKITEFFPWYLRRWRSNV